MEFLWALSAAVLLLAGQGAGERAVEVYSLLLQHSHIAHSRWFADVVGKPIAAVAAALPPDVVAQVEERGRTRDLQAVLAELVVELEG